MCEELSTDGCRGLVHPALPPEGSNADGFESRLPTGFRTCRQMNVPNGRASQLHSGASAFNTAVVPAYRCGTVPDSHRIPYSITSGD